MEHWPDSKISIRSGHSLWMVHQPSSYASAFGKRGAEIAAY